MFKKYFLCMSLLLTAFGIQVFASGIQVQGTEVTTNKATKTAQVKFTLTWDHSWRVADAPGNYDAAWVFIKYRTLPGENWNHAYISTNGTNTTPPASHVVPTDATMKIGNAIRVVNNAQTTVGVGALIFRKTAGNGSVTFEEIELTWDFTKNGLSGGEQVEVCVLATEMVWIPAGAFWLGDYTSNGRFRINPSNGYYTGGVRPDAPFNVTGDAIPNYFSNYTKLNNYSNSTTNTYFLTPQTLGKHLASDNSLFTGYDDANPSNRGTLLLSSTNTVNDDAMGSSIHANYPRGNKAFFCMKYEITQGEYLQFLNKNLLTVKNAKTYFPAEVQQPGGRYAIQIKDGTGVGTIPTEYELKDANDAYLPCGYLGTKDITAWLIWAGLRPMTELEYEKACRGTNMVSATNEKGQYAWGNVDAIPALGLANPGMSNEAPSNSEGNIMVQASAGTGTAIGNGVNSFGPMRAGGFATPVSGRVKAGASYYGVMEMSGNMWERCITIGINDGRAFQGNIVNGHGNGEIGVGTAPELPTGGSWPAVTGAGLGFRGGSYLDPSARARVSDRYYINLSNTTRQPCFGGRGVRSDL